MTHALQSTCKRTVAFFMQLPRHAKKTAISLHELLHVLLKTISNCLENPNSLNRTKLMPVPSNENYKTPKSVGFTCL